MTLDRDLELEFVHVTEQAAIAAGHTMGLGDGKRSDAVAVDAMRKELNNLPMAGRIVIEVTWALHRFGRRKNTRSSPLGPPLAPRGRARQFKHEMKTDSRRDFEPRPDQGGTNAC